MNIINLGHNLVTHTFDMLKPHEVLGSKMSSKRTIARVTLEVLYPSTYQKPEPPLIE